MSRWTDYLTAEDIENHHALTASIDATFANAQRYFYEQRTIPELRALASQAWLCNDADAYQLARSYMKRCETEIAHSHA